MLNSDAMQTRAKIISFIRLRGPSLPVQIARETGLSILFASAFLSELYGEKEIKISNLRVGSSPLYYIAGQEPQLERFANYLKSKEKEAYLLLKERKILKDVNLQPAIRVALREIKDFAIPFEQNDEIFWRFFLVEEPSEIETKKPAEIIEVIEKQQEQIPKTENAEEVEEVVIEIPEEIEIQEINVGEEIFQKEKPKKETKPKTKKTAKKKDENFFNKIKEFLSKKRIEIIDIKDFKNDEAVLKIKKKDEEELLFAFNTKKITEKEILKAHKKALESKMKYSILSLGETPKKITDLLSALKDLSGIEKVE